MGTFSEVSILAVQAVDTLSTAWGDLWSPDRGRAKGGDHRSPLRLGCRGMAPHPSSASLGPHPALRATCPPCSSRKSRRACAESTLPQCHSRACFATARQWRGCGNCWLPSSATGSGSQQFLGIFDRCGNSGFASSATGSAKPEFPVRGEGWKTGDRKGEAERRAPLRDQAGSIGAIGKEWFSRLSAQGTASEKKRR